MGSNVSGRRADPSRSSADASARARAILNDLRLLVRELRVSARDAEKRLGVSGAQLFVLQCLHRDETLSMGELAERTHTDQSSVSVVVSRLVERELVVRSPSREDARRVEVRLTAAGRRLVRFAPEATQVRLAEALAAMPVEASERLALGLADLVAQMGLAGPPRMFFEDDAGPRSAKPRPRQARPAKKAASRG